MSIRWQGAQGLRLDAAYSGAAPGESGHGGTSGSPDSRSGAENLAGLDFQVCERGQA